MPVANSDTATPPVESVVIVEKVIETTDGYILAGRIHPQPGVKTEPSGDLEIRDASGKIVHHTVPLDVSLDLAGTDPNDIPWARQFKAAGLVYPLTIRFPQGHDKPTQSHRDRRI